MKRNSKIVSIFIVSFILSTITMPFLIKISMNNGVFEEYASIAIKIATVLLILSGVTNKIVGEKIANGEENWDKVINEIKSNSMSFLELIMIISYVLLGIVASVIFSANIVLPLWKDISPFFDFLV